MRLLTWNLIVTLAVGVWASELSRVEAETVPERAIASEFGFDPSDATAALQGAIDSGARVVVVDKQASAWLVRPIRLRSDLTLILESGVEIAAKPGEFLGGGDCLMTANRVKNLRIVGGEGAVLRMRKRDYWSEPYKKAEWRHGVSLLSAENVVIENVTIAETGGDGVYVGVSAGAGPCRNITLRRVDCVENNRQGVSVISVDGLVMEDCVLRDTNGTAPEAGIDFEPNKDAEQITNVVMRRVKSINNAGDGFAFYLPNLRNHGSELSFEMEDCVAVHNSARAFSFTVANGENCKLPGACVVKNCELIGNRDGIAIRSKWADGAAFRFENVRIVTASADRKANFDYSKAYSSSAPKGYESWGKTTTDSGISLIAVGTDVDANGGLEFKNVEIIDGGDAGAPEFLMTLRDASSEGVGFVDITGSIRSTTVGGATRETTLNNAALFELFPSLKTRRVPAWDFAKLKDISTGSTALELAQAHRDRAKEQRNPNAFFRARGDADYYFFAEKGDEVAWTFVQRKIGSYPLDDVEVALTESTGEVVALEKLPAGGERKTYRYVAKETGWKHLRADFGASTVELHDATAPILTAARPSLDAFGTVGRFELYVPKDAEDLGVRVVGSAAERVTLRIVDPTGAEVAVLQDVSSLDSWTSPEDSATGKPVKPTPGFWTLIFERPTTGVLEDYVVTILGVPALLR